MNWIILLEVFVLIYIPSNTVISGITRYGQDPDNFVLTRDKMRRVTYNNCHSKNRVELELSPDSVAQVSTLYWKQFFDVIYSNRSKLLHLHNTAMSKGYHYSFLYAALNHSKYYQDLPDSIFLYMKTTADVSANQGWIDGSSLTFNNKSFYPNWLPKVDFNQTLSLFGIRSWKSHHDSDTKWVREPINSTDEELIRGNVFIDNSEKNYTDQNYKYCPFTRHDGEFWWPDDTGIKNFYWKQTYSVGLKFSNKTGHYKSAEFENISFWGPPTPWHRSSDLTLPVLTTQPYFDCGRSNKWIVSMTSPVTEFMTRYNSWTFLRRPRFTAIAAMDMEFEKIDLNPCPISEGNPTPNMFGGTARCTQTTECEPLSGFGFRRDGYQCVCKPDLYYPWGQEGPFQGVDIETASEEELNNGTFDCVSAEELSNYNGTETITPGQKKRFETFDEGKWPDAQVVMLKAKSFPASCDKPVPLSTGIVSGASEQFEAQGRTALGISHFLSNFLQNSWALHDVLYANNEYPKPPFKHYLKEIYVFAEVLAPLMGDLKLSGVGVYFDRNKFATADGISKELFAPYAYKIAPKENEESDYRVIDLAGHGTYPDEDWFLKMKQRWTNSMGNLSRFSDSSAIYGGAQITFRAPEYTDGEWSGPMYKCDNMLTDWVFTYRVPFFGPKSSGTSLEFKGVVAVDVKVEHLDINQCPTEDQNNDVFSNTAKCHYDTQYCVPVPGKKFTFGGYMCVFRQGYALPANFTYLHNINTHQGGSFHGETMEIEYGKKERNETHRHDYLKGEEIQTSTTITTVGPVGGAIGLSIEHVALRMIICTLTILLCIIT